METIFLFRGSTKLAANYIMQSYGSKLEKVYLDVSGVS